MEFGGFQSAALPSLFGFRRICNPPLCLPYLGFGGFVIRRIAIPYFLTLNL